MRKKDIKWSNLKISSADIAAVNNVLRKSDISYQIPDSTKFNKITKWKPKINIKDSIEFLIKETQKL